MPPMAASSFDALYASEYAAVVRVAFALTGRLAVAEELSQEAFLSAYRRWDQIGRYDDPAAWVRRVVTNRCVSAWRRGFTEARLLARLGQEPSTYVVGNEQDDALWRAVRRLPARQRQVIALVVVDDRSVADAAVVLEISEDSVRTHLRRAKAHLAKRLGEPESDR